MPPFDDLANFQPQNQSPTLQPPDNSNPTVDETTEPPCIPSGKSITHFDLLSNNVVYCSLDVETGGEYCGIIQLSVELFCFNNEDPDYRVDHIEPTFNEYVRPPDGAIWNEASAQTSHRLHANSPQILSASTFNTV